MCIQNTLVFAYTLKHQNLIINGPLPLYVGLRLHCNILDNIKTLLLV